MSSSSSLDWQVLLIGGASGVGKSVVAQALARRLRISHMLVDDIRLAIQAVTSPAQAPALHTFLLVENPATLSPEAFVGGLIGVGRALMPALRAVISHHVAVPEAGRLILEGDGLLPELVTNLALTDALGASLSSMEGKVRGVFIHEVEEAQLLRDFMARDRGFNAGPSAEQRYYVHAVWRYGMWLKTEAERCGVPVVPARPYATLVQRVLETASGGSAHQPQRSSGHDA